MHSSILWCLALLFLSNGVLTLTERDRSLEPTQKRPHLRQLLPDTNRPATTTLSTSTAGLVPYIIVMQQSATREQIQDINNKLLIEAAPGSLQTKTRKRTGLVVFFTAEISSALANAIERLPGVGAVSPDLTPEEEQPPTPSAPLLIPRGRQLFGKGRSSSRDSDYLHLKSIRNPAEVCLQRQAETELKVISQPPGAASAEDLPGFAYAAEAGKGVTIYVIDTGANIQNPEWRNMTGSKRFIYLPGVNQTETDPDGHGSCIASKATGPEFGIAKGANIVMVKLKHNVCVVSYILAALVEIENDVYDEGIQGKAVVNISYSCFLYKNSSSTIAFRLLLHTLIDEDIVIVTSSGNKRRFGFFRNKLSSYPALFASSTDVIVVGAVEDDGSRSRYSQGTAKELTTSAPGEVYCASAETPTFTWDRGTSFASLPSGLAVPAVVGVIAVWLSQDIYAARLQVPGKVAANVKAMVKEFSYPRIENGPPAIWNGIDPRGLAT
ncbi:Subtilisin-like protease 2 [Colletotrichum tanaceti]|nr:Subtilisin-like protease 2 [Colletotrichum tanaceti]